MRFKVLLGLNLLVLFLAFACSPSGDEATGSAEENLPAKEEAKELDMYEASELALLMREMYASNLALRDSLLQGVLPPSFPEDFRRIHSAEATDPAELDETFKALATQYLAAMDSIVSAQEPAQAQRHYNALVETCASCHQIYCQGPLAKIRRMRISESELWSAN